MVYLLLLLLALSTPLGTYFFSNHMAYHFHYHPLAHSNQWFWKRDMSDEDLDWIAHQHSKKFARLATLIISTICFLAIGYLIFSGMLNS